MATFSLEPVLGAVHGSFCPNFDPILTVDSGDTVRYRTIDVTWGLEQHPSEASGIKTRAKLGPRVEGRDDGPAMVGPVAVRGAIPGTTLAIHLDVIEPENWGWTYIGPTQFTTELLERLRIGKDTWRVVRWDLEVEANTALSELGHRVTLSPFLGTVGLSPGGDGLHSGWLPTRCGGNMDCKEFVAGTVLYLPVEADGALVSLGDGHARQGDGEVAGSAIECRMKRVDCRFVVHDDFPVTAPRAKTPTGRVTIGVDRDLDLATAMALNEMLDWLQADWECERDVALAIASTVVDLRITQLVNGVRGVHAVLDDDAVALVRI